MAARLARAVVAVCLKIDTDHGGNHPANQTNRDFR
jgi:hypothetical protein